MTSIDKTIRSINNTTLRRWLQKRGLRHSASNVAALIELVERLIKEGKLSKDELDEAVREIEEYGGGGKRIYLRKLKDKGLVNDKRKFSRHLSSLGISLDSAPNKTFTLPSTPRLNYAYWGEDEVRIKYSEKHVFTTSNKRTRKWTDEDKTVFIIISVDQSTGLVQILMDPPGDDHPHLSDRGNPSDAAYVQHYLSRAEELVGEFETVELRKRSAKLLKLNPPIFIATAYGGTDADNARISVKSKGDVRESRSYKAAVEDSEEPCLNDDIQGEWRHSSSKNTLLRDVWMQIKAADSMIKFRANCLGHEVDYAISTIVSL